MAGRPWHGSALGMKRLPQVRAHPMRGSVTYRHLAMTWYDTAVCYHADTKGKFDELVEEKGVRILIEPAALMHVLGTKMDFVEDQLRCAGWATPRTAPPCRAGLEPACTILNFSLHCALWVQSGSVEGKRHTASCFDGEKMSCPQPTFHMPHLSYVGKSSCSSTPTPRGHAVAGSRLQHEGSRQPVRPLGVDEQLLTV